MCAGVGAQLVIGSTRSFVNKIWSKCWHVFFMATDVVSQTLQAGGSEVAKLFDLNAFKLDEQFGRSTHTLLRTFTAN